MLELVILPVADVDRAKSFHEGLRWWLEGDASAGADYRLVQTTPPESSASIVFGKAVTSAEPGSIGSLLGVNTDSDLERALGPRVVEALSDA